MIESSHLSKRYRKKIAVDDLSFSVESGKVTGFLGPNGAGKSTTMRLMLGLDKGGGRTLYDGKQLQEYAQPSKVVGILLEAKAFHPTRTAYQHLAILADAGGVDQSRVNEVLDIVGLNDVAKKKPGKFSLGMSQRLGIAAAILAKPKHLLLDEPANGLDPEGIAWLRKFIKDYASAGNALFVSSHLLSEMGQMADNIVVIGKGKIIVSSSMEGLLNGAHHAGVLVRTTDMNKLRQILKKMGVDFKDVDKSVLIRNKTTDEVGKLLFDAGLQILELSAQEATLEEAFLQVTSGAEEFVQKGGAQ